MNPSRIWTLGAAVAVVAVLGAAFVLGIQPQLASAAVAKASTAQTQTQLDTTQTELARLSRSAAKQADLQADADDLRWAIPRTLQLSTFSQQLRAIAALDGVKITALTPGTVTQYVSPIAAPASTSSTTAGSTPASSPSPSPTATASAAATAATTAGTADDPGWFGTTDPSVTDQNFLVIPMTIIVTGEEAPGVAFADDAQRMRRLFIANTVTFQASTDDGTPPTTTISGEMYALKR